MALEQDPAVILEVCQAQFTGLDEDTLEYIVGILESCESDDLEDTIETIAGFLISSEVHDEEEEATAAVNELLAKLTVQESAVADAPEAEPEAPKKAFTIGGIAGEDAGFVVSLPSLRFQHLLFCAVSVCVRAVSVIVCVRCVCFTIMCGPCLCVT